MTDLLFLKSPGLNEDKRKSIILIHENTLLKRRETLNV
jgi:hypothetical protein